MAEWRSGNLESIPIPYGFTIKAVTIAGVVYFRDPVENTSTEGFVVGAVNGTYKLDKDKTRVRLYDPTGALLRLVIELNLSKQYVRFRLDTKQIFSGKWSKGSWVYARF